MDFKDFSPQRGLRVFSIGRPVSREEAGDPFRVDLGAWVGRPWRSKCEASAVSFEVGSQEELGDG